MAIKVGTYDTRFQFHHHFDSLPPKSDWYRFPERERNKTKALLPQGSYLRTQRLLIRAGYWIEPQDMPEDLLQERIHAHVRNTVNFYLANPENWKIRDAFNYWDSDAPYHYTRWNKPYDGYVTDEMADMFIEATGASEETIFRNLIYQLRHEWMHDEKRKEHKFPVDLKMFFFADLPEVATLQVQNRIVRQCGRWFPGAYHIDGDDPPYLSQTVTQVLYYVGFKGFDSRKHNMLYVHPLDVLEGE